MEPLVEIQVAPYQGQHTLPMGLAEDLRAAQVKIFCPKCEQAMTPTRTDADRRGPTRTNADQHGPTRDGKHMTKIEKGVQAALSVVSLCQFHDFSL